MVDYAMTDEESEELDRKVDAGIKRAIAEALEEHRRMGRAVVVWKDGKIVSIPPSDIPAVNAEPDPEFARQVEAAESVMSEDGDALRKLAE